MAVATATHDPLLDPEFKERHPERWQQAVQTASDNEDLRYLDFPAANLNREI